jgi:hypothetical protein
VNSTLAEWVAGPAGAAVVALLWVYAFIKGKVVSAREFNRLLRENNELKVALADERKVANEAVRTGSVTNRLIGALVEVTSEHRHEGRDAGPLGLPRPGPYPDVSEAGDAEM